MIVFVHIEKTAGTTLKFNLRNTFGKRHCDTKKNKKQIFDQRDLEFAQKVFGKIDCISGHNLVEPTTHLAGSETFFITFLRDPIERSASYYQDHCLRGKYKISFEDWMKEDKRHNMQTKRIAGSNDLEKAKKILYENYQFVGLTERFDESLKLLSVVLPMDLNLKYKRKLIAQDNTIKNNLINTPATYQILKDCNKQDIALYDFVKNTLFEERIQQHKQDIEQVQLPDSYYKSHRTWNYQSSIAFNKFVYRQILKIRNNTKYV